MSDKELLPWQQDAAPGAAAPAATDVAPSEAAAVEPSEPQPEPAAAAAQPPARAGERRWAGLAQTVVAAIGTLVAAAWLLQPGATLGATAADWLPALGAEVPANLAPWPLLMAKLVLRLPADVRADPLWALMWLQTMVAWLLLWGVVALGRKLGGWRAAAAALALVLLWPTARESAACASAEVVLAAAGLWAAWAAAMLPTAPWRGSAVLGLATATMALVHPVGVVAAPLVLLAALVLPVAHSPEALETAHGRPDLPAGQRWLAWMAACALAAGLLLLALHGGTFKVWGAGQLAILREAGDRPALGGLAELPLFGLCLALIAQTPVAVVALAWAGAVRGLGHDVQEAAGAAMGVMLALLASLAVVGAPFPSHLDPLPVLAPLWCVLAGGTLHFRGQALLLQQRWLAAGLFAAAIAMLVVGEGHLLQIDRRGVLARLPWILTEAEPHWSVALRPADVALLQRFAQPTAVLPARPGGAAVATALKGIAPNKTGAVFVHPHRAQLIMLPEPPRHPIDRAFGDHSSKVACTADFRYCLHRLGGTEGP